MNREQYLKLAAKEGKSFKFPRVVQLSPIILPPSFTDVVEYDIFEPQNFDEYIGQDRAKALVKIMIEAADKENRPLPNMIIAGSYGLGKTTLAKLILKGKPYQETTGTAANTRDNFSGYILVDEIHNIRPEICDDINKKLDSGRLRIVGCTTNPGLLPGPFRSRFRVIQLEAYTVEDLTQIQYNAINRKGTITASYALLEEISKRGRSTPRRTLQYLAFIMDLMSVKNEGVLTQETLDEAFDKLGVDNLGLLDIDHRYLNALPTDRPVGLQYLTSVLQIDKDTIEQEIEPYLMQQKLIDRTTRGRYKIGNLEQQLEESLEAIFGIKENKNESNPSSESSE